MSIEALSAPAGGRIIVAGPQDRQVADVQDRVGPELGGASFTFKLQRELDKHGIRLYLVDGNHDNHTALRALPRDDAGFGVVRTKTKDGGQLDLIRWVPRGHRW